MSILATALAKILSCKGIETLSSSGSLGFGMKRDFLAAFLRGNSIQLATITPTAWVKWVGATDGTLFTIRLLELVEMHVIGHVSHFVSQLRNLIDECFIGEIEVVIFPCKSVDTLPGCPIVAVGSREPRTLP